MDTTTTTTTVEPSKTKKVVIYSAIGVIVVLSVVAAFVPEAREYCHTMVTNLLGTIIVPMVSQ